MKNPQVTIKFNIGEIQLELFSDVPNSTANFISLANSGFYDGLTMHRVIDGFVAQGGCPDGTGTGGPGYSIDGEFASNGFENNHKHKRGAIAWARSMARNSAGSQFYLTLADVPHLDGDYAVFGQVIDGFDVLDNFGEYGTPSGKPRMIITIESVTVDLFGEEIPEVVKV